MSVKYRIRDKSFVSPELACNLVPACYPVPCSSFISLAKRIFPEEAKIHQCFLVLGVDLSDAQ
jgi:hypothetical protein